MMTRIEKNRFRLKALAEKGSYRFSVFRSNKHVYAQIIDEKGLTIASSSSSSKNCVVYSKNKTEKGSWVGNDIVSKLKDKSIKVYFDRGGYAYHGVVKAVAEAARSAGLGF